jgi:phenylacetate-coenzyme A ligase PaaK-like adenylate-forming protein
VISPVDAWTGKRTGLFADLGPEALERWQMEKLRGAVGHARENGRFYAGKLAGVEARSLLSQGDLARLPFTWPSDLLRDPLAFLCVPQGEVARVTTLATSGSTGERKRVFFTQGDLERTVDFFAHGMGTLVRGGQQVLILMSGETEDSIGRLLRTALARIRVRARIRGAGWGASEVLAAARSADCLVGLPADLLYLCRTDGSLRPASVLLSADYAPPCVLEALRETWGCRALTHFGMTETGFGGAVQCAHGEGHHLRHPDLLVEIVDPGTGRQLPPGIRGEIVLTTLRNEAMPLLRYRTGDLSRLETGPCACGGILARLGRVEGRLENELPLGNGEALSIHRLDDLLFALPSVRAFEAELGGTVGRPRLSLTVDARGGFDRDAVAANLPSGLELAWRQAPLDPFARPAKRRIRTIPLLPSI